MMWGRRGHANTKTAEAGRGLNLKDKSWQERGRNLPVRDGTGRERGQPPVLRVSCQGPTVQSIPPQLVAMRRLRGQETGQGTSWLPFTMWLLLTQRKAVSASCVFCLPWQAADVKLHDPTACCICVREKASLALKSFIRRKETQLHFQTLKGRQNTHA